MITPSNLMLHPWPNDTVVDLCREVRSRLQKHLLELLQQIERALGVSLDAAARTVRRLDVDAKLSPGFHVIYWSLREAMQRSDLDAVIDLVHYLSDPSIMDFSDHHLRVGSILSERWEHPIINEYRAMSFGHEVEESRSDGGRVVVRPVIDESFEDDARSIERALHVISVVDPSLHREIDHHLCRVKFFSGSTSPGGSTIKAQGTIFMMPARGRSPDPVVYYVDWLVHECAHMHLGALMILMPLLDEGSSTMVASPLRPDLRSMHGVLHAVFVLARLVRTFRALLASTDAPVQALDRAQMQRRLAQHEQHLVQGASTIEDSATLTAAGQQFFAPIAELAQQTREQQESRSS